MAEKYDTLSAELRDWIAAQQVFFVATAAPDGHVNVSPKGQDSLRVLDERTLLWLNLTGSGNETAAHLKTINRMTLMWCAFSGPPRILRVYGQAKVVHPRDPEWASCTETLDAPLGARQYFLVDIEFVQTSCGYAVPLMDFQENRQALAMWSDKRGADGIRDYWVEKNVTSLDGLPTGIVD